MLFAQEDARPLIQFTLAPLFRDEGLPLAVMGIFVVFVALVLVAGAITLLPRVLEKISPELSPKTDMPPSLADEDLELSGELLAVIAAAVAETVRVPHRIVRIGGWSAEDQGWSLGGRILHHQSHKIQPRDRR